VRRVVVVLGFLASVTALLGAQDAAGALLMKRLGLTERQAEQFIAVYRDSRSELLKARAEINVQKALLAQMLLDVDVPLKDVERVLRAAMAAELQVRMIQIRQELAARRIIGDARWTQLRDLVRLRAAMKERAGEGAAADRTTKNGGDASSDEKKQALLQELYDLLGESP
jgi:hypothetical protein